MAESFYSIGNQGESLYKEKGSKFIGIALPVASEDEVKEALAALRKQYYDARHHCYAYILGADAAQWRANDDGEPAHSAGDPILGQIKSRELSNTLVVVIRYFGGTKLGVGGLIHAYKTAAAEALDMASRVQHFVSERYVINTNYDDYNSILALSHLPGFRVMSEQFETGKITLTIQLHRKDRHHVERLQKELYASQFKLISE